MSRQKYSLTTPPGSRVPGSIWNHPIKHPRREAAAREAGASAASQGAKRPRAKRAAPLPRPGPSPPGSGSGIAAGDSTWAGRQAAGRSACLPAASGIRDQGSCQLARCLRYPRSGILPACPHPGSGLTPEPGRHMLGSAEHVRCRVRDPVGSGSGPWIWPAPALPHPYLQPTRIWTQRLRQPWERFRT